MADRKKEGLSRPVRIGNCSGSKSDPDYQMYRQATRGPIDFLTGDYLAEMNIAENAVAMSTSEHDGWEPTAYEGLDMTLDVINEKRIKVIINGGALNPAGLARKVQALVTARGHDLAVGYIYGDNLLVQMQDALKSSEGLPNHLDSMNEEVSVAYNALDLLDTKRKPLVSANVYLGAQAIVKGLELGADILICGRVADASPVIGAAWWWHKWSETDYDQLASALIAGHFLECSAYVTGANFSGFDEYAPEMFVDLPFPIAEIAEDGTSVITKHEGTNGIVTEDTCTSQLLYELQGSVYLNSDVSADIRDIRITQSGKDRVTISNVKGYPPPPTTKLAIFYHGGYEAQILTNATGYNTTKKWKLFEAQMRFFLKLRNLEDKFQLLDFQTLGINAPNPETQFSSTTYCRILAQADNKEHLLGLLRCLQDHGQQHFSGFHLSLDLRTAIPRPYLAFYPALFPQNSITDGVALLSSDGNDRERVDAKKPPVYQELRPRDNYETSNPINLESLGTSRLVPLGDIVQARSGDKGANINIGFFVRRAEHYPWLQAFMTKTRMQGLMGKDWRKDYFLERCEFPNIHAVHFVIYGPLGRGVTSCRLLDCLGKGFADYIRDKVVEVPEKLLDDILSIKAERAAWQSN